MSSYMSNKGRQQFGATSEKVPSQHSADSSEKESVIKSEKYSVLREKYPRLCATRVGNSLVRPVRKCQVSITVLTAPLAQAWGTWIDHDHHDHDNKHHLEYKYSKKGFQQIIFIDSIPKS